MKIVECSRHHFYDSEKYGNCPYCMDEDQGDFLTDEDGMPIGAQDVTVFLPGEEGNEDQTISASIYGMPEEKTISLFSAYQEVDKIAGWLVCIQGKKRGASWQIVLGRNFIGRSLRMEICFSEDLSVSRENHASIVFDDRSNVFYLVPGYGEVLLEGCPVRQVERLKEDMCMEIGEGIYRFVPYCNERRRWE